MRERIAPGTIGTVSVVLLGRVVGDDREVAIPRPPGGWSKVKIGQPFHVLTVEGPMEYEPTRWRGLVRAVDVDGKEYMVRRWRSTRAAAEAATRQAGMDKLASLAESRTDALRPPGTTIKDLLATWRLGLADESNELHLRTVNDYDSVIRSLLGEPLRPLRSGGAERPRDPERMVLHDTFESIANSRPSEVDARQLKDLFRAIANASGAGTAIKVRSILAHVWDLAMEDRSLGVQVNLVRSLRGTESNPVIPKKKKRASELDPRRAPTDDEYSRLMAALAADPEAAPMQPGVRHKSRHGAAGTGEPNGKDLLALVQCLFYSGARVGELLALRWVDVVLDGGEPHLGINATLTYVPGQPLTRTPTKTRGGTRRVHLVPPAVALLRQRASNFGVDLARPPETPVFGSPQAPERFRDPNNLNRTIRKVFNRHGVTWGRSHIGRKYVVNALLREHVPLHEIAAVVGWSDVLTVTKYADTGVKVSASTRAAMARFPAPSPSSD